MPCPICLMPRKLHGECLQAALTWTALGRYETPVEPTLARRLAPTCYLCGTAKTENAEHVIPRSRSGSDLWTNTGGACLECNMTKGHALPKLTAQQRTRLQQQQANYRAAHARVQPEIIATELAHLARSWTWDIAEPHLDEMADAVTDTLGMLTEYPFTTAIENDLVVVHLGKHKMIVFFHDDPNQ